MASIGSKWSQSISAGQKKMLECGEGHLYKEKIMNKGIATKGSHQVHSLRKKWLRIIYKGIKIYLHIEPKRGIAFNLIYPCHF